MPTEHNNKELVKLYKDKGYQGADPEKAKYLFIGLDANFAPNIACNPVVFSRVKEYLRNGADFWRKYRVHHPFLLPEYKGMGRPYHKRFQEIGFNKCHADDVSFLELLHYPTEDEKSDVKPRDLCHKHLAFLGEIITSDAKKCVFVTYDVASIMKRTKKFPWLSPNGADEYMSIRRLWKNDKTGTRVFKFYHFSTWGTYRLRDEEIRKIGELAGIR